MAIDAKKRRGIGYFHVDVPLRQKSSAQRTGEVKKRRFLSRRPNKSRRRLSAAYRDQKEARWKIKEAWASEDGRGQKEEEMIFAAEK